MLESSSTPLDGYRRGGDAWVPRLLRLYAISSILVLCAFYLAPKVAGVQTTFYLTILPSTLALLCLRKDFSFLLSAQFLAFISLPVALTLSSLWGNGEAATVTRDPTFYLKLALYLALFYCGLYLAREQFGAQLFRDWILCLIPVGLLSCIASLVLFALGDAPGGQRIGGMSLDGDIDKTGMLYGFYCLFCCYGLTSSRGLWRGLSWAGLIVACCYILLSQTKVPIVMAAVAVTAAAWITHSRLLKLLVLLGVFALFPLAYLVLFGDLPLLHRSAAYSIRLELWNETLQEFLRSPWIGSGLVHKQFLQLDGLPHPHNYLLDIARFSGLVGLSAALWQAVAALQAGFVRGSLRDPLHLLLVSWMGFGALAMLVYAQQPLVKPDYIWLFYWIPLAALLINTQRGAAQALSKSHHSSQSPAVASAK